MVKTFWTTQTGLRKLRVAAYGFLATVFRVSDLCTGVAARQRLLLSGDQRRVQRTQDGSDRPLRLGERNELDSCPHFIADRRYCILDLALEADAERTAITGKIHGNKTTSEIGRFWVVECDPKSERRDIYNTAVAPTQCRFTCEFVGSNPARRLAVYSAAILHHSLRSDAKRLYGPAKAVALRVENRPLPQNPRYRTLARLNCFRIVEPLNEVTPACWSRGTIELEE
jgi:hypothetical protein